MYKFYIHKCLQADAHQRESDTCGVLGSEASDIIPIPPDNEGIKIEEIGETCRGIGKANNRKLSYDTDSHRNESGGRCCS